ncbi:hypothetical protein BH10PSE9_BH10PSE9_08740 [soil metagenome]
MHRTFLSAAFAAFAAGILHDPAAAASRQPATSDIPWLVQIQPGSRLLYPPQQPQMLPPQAAPAMLPPQAQAQPPRRGFFGLFRAPTAQPPQSQTAALFGPAIARPVAPGDRYLGRATDPAFLPAMVSYSTDEARGTIVIDTNARYLYFVLGDGKAMRYGVGVGRPGFEWAGSHRVTRKAEWPDWVPPDEMRDRVPNLPVRMEGGPNNPLGARAMYLGSTLYRIHGSNEPWTIGHAVSSGCIRMRNEDVIDLYERVEVGTKVVVI